MANPSGLSHVYVGAARWRNGAVGGIFRRQVGEDRFEPMNKGLPEQTNVQGRSPSIRHVQTSSTPGPTTARSGARTAASAGNV